MFFQVDNPRQLPFSYFIYAQNREIERGFAKTFTYRTKVRPGIDYFVSIQYTWMAKPQSQTYRLALDKNQLKLEVKQPDLVVPGQIVPIEIQIKDYKGKPLKDLDLTAFSLTSKFEYKPPDLSRFMHTNKRKNQINRFFLKREQERKGNIRLNYSFWEKKAGLDSMIRFQFLYPRDSIFTYSYTPKEKVSQIAPYVVAKGSIQNTHIIYLDGRPVYFSWNSEPSPYSFKCSPGYHRLGIRTLNKEFWIDSVYVPQNKKLILSLDEDYYYPKSRKELREPKLSEAEQQKVYPYIFPYQNPYPEKLSILSRGNKHYLLKPNTRANPRYSKYNYSIRPYFTGPVRGIWELEVLEHLKMDIAHEPNYEYHFEPQKLKMRSLHPGHYYPTYLSGFQSRKSLEDEALSTQKIEEQWAQMKWANRQTVPRYDNPEQTTFGNGSLHIRLAEENWSLLPLNFLLTSLDSTENIRIYPGNHRRFYDLKPGSYRLIAFYENDRYSIEDSIYIQGKGTNFLQLYYPDSLKTDTFSIKLDHIFDQNISSPEAEKLQKREEIQKIQDVYREQFSVSTSSTVRGTVVDGETGEALIGASVLIKGTTAGMFTNSDGFFGLSIPEGGNTLVVTYLGYKKYEIQITDRNLLIKLDKSDLSLDEVVITGYGIKKESKSMGYSVSVINSAGLVNNPELLVANILRGKASGVDIVQAKGGAHGKPSILIRGANSINSNNSPIYVVDGIPYTGEELQISPENIKEMQVLKGAEATAIYGSRAANGVVIISTLDQNYIPSVKLTQIELYETDFLQELEEASSLRSNFSDYAFWKPCLRTDKEGKVTFEVQFPDDITSWDTHILALGKKFKYGLHSHNTRAYKPLMAQLAVPRFLVAGDSSVVIGKILNYTSDSALVKSKFTLKGDSLIGAESWLKDSQIDSLSLVAENDSLEVSYSLLTSDYEDGERREIPVLPQGLEIAKGQFVQMEGDTSLTWSFDPELGPVSFYAQSNILPEIRRELSQVINYRYDCNEQMASKLKALLMEEHIAEVKEEKFREKNEIKNLIRKLIKNQNQQGLWAWWGKGSGSLPISLHALEALMQAKERNYRLEKLQLATLISQLQFKLPLTKSFQDKIRMLQILLAIESSYDFQAEIKALSEKEDLSIGEKLQLMELNSQRHYPIQRDSLLSWMDSTIFGNLYIRKPNDNFGIWNNEIQHSLRAYRILKADPQPPTQILRKMRNYFLEIRNAGNWRNTFESVQIAEAILPDLLKESKTLENPKLELSGSIEKSLTRFPQEFSLAGNEPLHLRKTGTYPLYVSASQKSWLKKPEKEQEHFVLHSYFKGTSDQILKGGQKSTLLLKLEVKAFSEYVMINIPIPAGCSYANKDQKRENEVHREYFKEKVSIFCKTLSPGKYEFKVDLIPRFSGSYHLNPAKAELMYFPTFYGNNEPKKLEIK
ncbi:MAG: carboxypeptidase-like regulatory domain-containing protein [Bacteroidota bacterium]